MERRDAYLNRLLLPIPLLFKPCVCVFLNDTRLMAMEWNGVYLRQVHVTVKEERNVNERFYRLSKESVIEKLIQLCIIKLEAL